MSKPEIPKWVTTLTDAQKSGRKIRVMIDNDSVIIEDVTDVPPDNDPRWDDASFEPYRDMFPDDDLMPLDVIVGLFAALGVKAEAI